MNCGHLRVYHAKGLPEGEFEERQGVCLFCEIAQLRNDLTAARLERGELLKLADKWENAIKVAYNDYSYGQRIAFEQAARELLEIVESPEHPTTNEEKS